MFFGLPAEWNTYTWYEKESNHHEKVLYIFYKGFLPTQGHWEAKRVIDVPDWHFRWEQDSNKNKLNGVWKVYDMDNDFTYARTILFSNGEPQE